MLGAWKSDADHDARLCFLEASRASVDPVAFAPAAKPETSCPAYRGVARGYHRCAANDIPAWETFQQFSGDEPGVATCGRCNWPHVHGASDRPDA